MSHPEFDTVGKLLSAVGAEERAKGFASSIEMVK
jgi:hypothetical protein